jgi:hypothetical protein
MEESDAIPVEKASFGAAAFALVNNLIEQLEGNGALTANQVDLVYQNSIRQMMDIAANPMQAPPIVAQRTAEMLSVYLIAIQALRAKQP